jgi:hypothetical protein
VGTRMTFRKKADTKKNKKLPNKQKLYQFQSLESLSTFQPVVGAIPFSIGLFIIYSFCEKKLEFSRNSDRADSEFFGTGEWSHDSAPRKSFFMIC